MRRFGGFFKRGLLRAPSAFIFVVLTANQAHADLSALVPSYFAPGTGGPGGVGDVWAQMAQDAKLINITAIVNPNSGPVDVGIVNVYSAAAGALQSNGGQVIG